MEPRIISLIKKASGVYSQPSVHIRNPSDTILQLEPEDHLSASIPQDSTQHESFCPASSQEVLFPHLARRWSNYFQKHQTCQGNPLDHSYHRSKVRRSSKNYFSHCTSGPRKDTDQVRSRKISLVIQLPTSKSDL